MRQREFDIGLQKAFLAAAIVAAAFVAVGKHLFPAQQRRDAGTEVNERLMDVSRIVEKPAPADAPSRLGVAGRYILTPGVLDRKSVV